MQIDYQIQELQTEHSFTMRSNGEEDVEDVLQNLSEARDKSLAQLKILNGSLLDFLGTLDGFNESTQSKTCVLNKIQQKNQVLKDSLFNGLAKSQDINKFSQLIFQTKINQLQDIISQQNKINPIGQARNYSSIKLVGQEKTDEKCIIDQFKQAHQNGKIFKQISQGKNKILKQLKENKYTHQIQQLKRLTEKLLQKQINIITQIKNVQFEYSILNLENSLQNKQPNNQISRRIAYLCFFVQKRASSSKNIDFNLSNKQFLRFFMLNNQLDKENSQFFLHQSFKLLQQITKLMIKINSLQSFSSILPQIVSQQINKCIKQASQLIYKFYFIMRQYNQLHLKLSQNKIQIKNIQIQAINRINPKNYVAAPYIKFAQKCFEQHQTNNKKEALKLKKQIIEQFQNIIFSDNDKEQQLSNESITIFNSKTANEQSLKKDIFMEERKKLDLSKKEENKQIQVQQQKIKIQQKKQSSLLQKNQQTKAKNYELQRFKLSPKQNKSEISKH